MPSQQDANTHEFPTNSQEPHLMVAASAVTPEKVIAAFDCARTRRQLPAYTRDTALDDQANAILKRVIANPQQPLNDYEQGFTLTGQLMLDATYPVLSECMVGGFDVARVEQLERSSRIGVAIAPMQLYEDLLYLTIVVGD